MKVLIFTCNTGEGHNSAASAIKEVFNANGYECDITDSLQFLSAHTSRFISRWHSRIYKYAPSAFGKGYSMAESHASLTNEKSLFYHLLMRGVSDMYDFVCKNGYDVILCVHPFAALMLTKMMRKHKPNIITGFVATDYTCSPTVDISDLDMYFIPHEDLKDEFASYGIPLRKIFASGIPIKRDFYQKGDKQAAKAAVGISDDKRNILLMCGSMGCGPIKKLTLSLSRSLPNDVILTVLCGRNKRLYRELNKLARSNVNVVSFTDKIPQFMDSAELYLTKAGGLSTTEGAAKHLPMVFINAIAGCEDHNRKFFLYKSCAVAPETINLFPDTVNQLLSDETLLNSYAYRLEQIFPKNAADSIYKYIIDKKSSTP